jgi:monoamine oxidase
VLTDPHTKPQKLADEELHAGARRVAGGMIGLVEGIAAGLQSLRVALSHVLTSVTDCGGYAEMRLDTPGGEVEMAARQVVFAIPPRLIEEHILFSPALPGELQTALLARPTWMAQQAKAVVVYGSRQDFSEHAGSGNAFVHHEQAVLGQVFDASSMDRTVAALGGFLALSPAQRVRFHEGLEMLVTSQFVQLFGPAFEKGKLQYQDWASEPFTCATLDRREPAIPAYPRAGDRGMHVPLWDGKLWFAGSEFALRQAGYLEGALTDAARVAKRLIRRRQESRWEVYG